MLYLSPELSAAKANSWSSLLLLVGFGFLELYISFLGYIAGVFCAVVSHPADTIVSKLNKDASATAGSIIKDLGFAGLWKGLTPRIIMIGTLTALQWFIYDTVKVHLCVDFGIQKIIWHKHFT